MMIEDGSRSRSHGLRHEVLEAQAQRMGMEIRFIPCTWSTYEFQFRQALEQFASEGVTHGIFGDIDFLRNRKWVENLAAATGLVALEPLWGQDRRDLLEEFVAAGFKAKVVAIKEGALPPDLLGEEVGDDLFRAAEARGCDPSGEQGEYHTVVYDGPLFSHALTLHKGRTVLRGSYHVLDVQEFSQSALPDSAL